MRKAFMIFLAAGTAAAPLAAAPVEVEGRSEVQLERQEQRASVREARAQARQERAAAPREARADRAPEERAERREQRQERQERRAERVERQAQPATVPVVRERRREAVAAAAPNPNRAERRDHRRDARIERRDDRRDAVIERRDDRRDARIERRDDRRDARIERRSTRNWAQSWSRDWRRDTRYDWNRYRYSRPSLFRSGNYYSPYRNYGYSRFSIGFFLEPLFYSRNYWISDPWQYRLPPAYPGTRWVRYFDDVLLVDMYSGEVVDVIHNFFW